MTAIREFTAVIHREDGDFVVFCPELDVASQGSSVEEARANLIEAVELYLEFASREEIGNRGNRDFFVTRIEILTGRRTA